jgi:hypothetical protein
VVCWKRRVQGPDGCALPVCVACVQSSQDCVRVRVWVWCHCSFVGAAKLATVVAVRTLDCAGSGFQSDVIAGIDWAVRNATGVRWLPFTLALLRTYHPFLYAPPRRVSDHCMLVDRSS